MLTTGFYGGRRCPRGGGRLARFTGTSMNRSSRTRLPGGIVTVSGPIRRPPPRSLGAHLVGPGGQRDPKEASVRVQRVLTGEHERRSSR